MTRWTMIPDKGGRKGWWMYMRGLIEELKLTGIFQPYLTYKIAPPGFLVPKSLTHALIQAGHIGRIPSASSREASAKVQVYQEPTKTWKYLTIAKTINIYKIRNIK
ncbi:hypothetical protein GQR58_026132 [Nymphon striatum]|nr:hypothetical protein GQR58_026132 [Nymphon striatum]